MAASEDEAGEALAPGDAYWNESNRRVTPFDFDDDSDAGVFLHGFRSELKSSKRTDTADDDVLVNWDGEPCVDISGLSVDDDSSGGAARGDHGVSAVGRGSVGGRVTPISITSSSASFSSAAKTAPTSDYSGLADALRSGDSLNRSYWRRTPSSLTSESAFASAAAVTSSGRGLTPVQSARALVLPSSGGGCYEQVPLEHHRSLASKRALLDETVRLRDSDAVLAVLLFMQRSLKPALFDAELRRCGGQTLVRATYVSHLRQLGQHERAADILAMIGLHRQAAMVHYEHALSCEGGEQRIRALRRCASADVEVDDQEVKFFKLIVQQHISLLERQLPLQAVREAHNHSGRGGSVSSAGSLVGSSVLSTLYHCCTHYYRQPENHLGSPAAVRRCYDITELQYVLTAARARAAAAAWTDLPPLLICSSRFGGGRRLLSCVDAGVLTNMLARAGASPLQLAAYVELCEPLSRRAQLAATHGCHALAVDTYVALKNRKDLEEYCAKLDKTSSDYAYASAALSSPTVKWKN